MNNNSKFYRIPLQNSADGNSGLDLNVNTNQIDLHPEYYGFLGIGEGKVKAKIKKAGAKIKATVKKDVSKVTDAEKKAKQRMAARAKSFKVKEKAFIAKGKNALHNVADKLKKLR